jgi:hypothetical protein
MAMTPAEIEEERRRGRYAGPAAIAAGIMYPAGVLWTRNALADVPDNNAPAELRFVDRHVGEILASNAVASLGALLLAAVAVHLYKATKRRKPNLNPVVLVMGVFGPVALALGGMLVNLYFADVAADFTSRDFQSTGEEKRVADDLKSGPLRSFGVGLIVSGTAAIAFWFVVGSLNAMRVGLLTRFMGVLGIVIGPAFLIVAPTPIVMAFWLVAVGILFLGYWPRGLPPAWATGEAIPWPSTGEQRPSAEAERGRLDTGTETPGGSRDGEVEPVGPGVRKPDERELDAAPRRARRKRKRRR